MGNIKTDRALTELKKNFLFRGCDEEVFEEHINENTSVINHFAAKETIYEPKNYKKSIGVVLSGKAVVYSFDGARQVLLRTFGAGEVFGVAALFSSDDDFVTSIYAKTDCDVLFIGDEAVYSMIDEDAAVRKNYITFLSEKIRFLNRRITCFTAGSAERRLSLYLLGLPRTDGYVTLNISMSALSETLDVGRASLYRAFERLTSDGFIERGKKSVRIQDPEKMYEYYN